VQAFFVEHSVTPQVTKVGGFTRYEAGAITLLAGDLFATSRALLGPVDALYDRASAIALPPAMRPDYFEHVGALMPAGAPGLAITLEYEQAAMDGPPFSVPEAELRARYAGLQIDLLDDVPATGRAADAGAREKCFLVHF
jgi:thiopurine S-methyltransferase